MEDTLGAATVPIDPFKNELCHKETKCSPPLPFVLQQFADTTLWVRETEATLAEATAAFESLTLTTACDIFIAINEYGEK